MSETLLIMIIWHYIADYGLQTDYIAENKDKDLYVLIAHCAIHGAALASMGYMFASWIMICCHFEIDRHGLPKWIDQALHLISIFAVSYFLT